MKSHLNFRTPHFDFTSIIRYSMKTFKSEISKFKNFYCEIRWAHINPYSTSSRKIRLGIKFQSTQLQNQF